ncbi:glucose-fructose oxidoreductase domain-containing protein 1-like [Ruditapes philippinarum]|uniref:glucose-fructose oxidoreductase domain-containing protein 1-like n=1 Tax=Ruditapes philippinarum TaxID=129788 RepID=UPI00295BA6F9|nr:glucose-fructose oxidoreductase domain-containing protein 1-like [Ruditapes philippinarum]
MRKMLPGIGVFGTTPSIRTFVAILNSCGFKVVALWGRVKAEAEQLASELNIPISTDNVDEILLNKDVDVIVISCPPHMQSPIAVKALGIGKHVFCGTPAGPTHVESLKMVHAAGYYPKLAARMIYGLRFLPTIKTMKKLIEDGFLGELKICEIRVHYWNYPKEKFDWTCDEIMGGGILNSIGSNLIDIVTYLTSQKAISVHGMLKTYTKQTEKIKGIREITSDDFCSFQLELDYGACATVTINSHMPGQFFQEIIVVGTKARLTAKGADLYGQKNDSRKEELLHFDPINFKEEERYGVSEKTRSVIPTPYLKGVIRMMESVKEAFDKEEERQSYCQEMLEIAATFEDSLYVQTVIDAIKASNHSKEWEKVEVKIDEPAPSPILPHGASKT